MLHPIKDRGYAESFLNVLNLDNRSPHTFPFAVIPYSFCKTEMLTTHFLGKTRKDKQEFRRKLQQNLGPVWVPEAAVFGRKNR